MTALDWMTCAITSIPLIIYIGLLLWIRNNFVKLLEYKNSRVDAQQARIDRELKTIRYLREELALKVDGLTSEVRKLIEATKDKHPKEN